MKWIEVRKKANYKEISERNNISQVFAKILKNRGIETDEQIRKYLYGDYEDLYDASLLKDMDKSVSLLNPAIKNGNHIRIIGDYDVDGIMSTYILKSGLEEIGANVSYAIPHRIEDGYGLNISLIEKAVEDGVELIITCDNGISAKEAIDFAKEKGLTVIVTDHHDVPYEEDEKTGKIKYKLPNADAIVNPKQADCNYPFKGLCGAAVAYKVIHALYELIGKDEIEAKKYIQYAGFATVCDVMDLIDENRILVKIALDMLRTTTNKGLQALIKENEIPFTSIGVYHLGFILGPCLNASGRLDTAKRAVELLSTDDENEAVTIAAELHNLNDKRQRLTERGLMTAIDLIESTSIKDDKVLVVYLKDTHESIAGIIAGKIREKYYKPTFVLTDSEGAIKGSGRSIEGYMMYDELVKVKDLLLKFGGHPLAAGLSLEKDNLDAFRKALNSNCALSDEDLIEKVKIDVVMPIEYVSKRLCNEIEMLEPCGKANSKPVFAARDVVYSSCSIMGKRRNAMKFSLNDKNIQAKNGMFFADENTFLEKLESVMGKEDASMLLSGKGEKSINILYSPNINVFRGNEEVQLMIKDFC